MKVIDNSGRDLESERLIHQAAPQLVQNISDLTRVLIPLAIARGSVPVGVGLCPATASRSMIRPVTKLKDSVRNYYFVTVRSLK